MTSEEQIIVRAIVQQAIARERERISTAISNISMEYNGGFYGDPVTPNFEGFIQDVASAISGNS